MSGTSRPDGAGEWKAEKVEVSLVGGRRGSARRRSSGVLTSSPGGRTKVGESRGSELEPGARVRTLRDRGSPRAGGMGGLADPATPASAARSPSTAGQPSSDAEAAPLRAARRSSSRASTTPTSRSSTARRSPGETRAGDGARRRDDARRASDRRRSRLTRRSPSRSSGRGLEHAHATASSTATSSRRTSR